MSGRYKIVDIQQEPENLLYAYYVLKKIHRRMQMKAVRLLQVARRDLDKKGRRKVHLIMKSHTWEFAARLIVEELENIKCQIQKNEQMIEKNINS